MLRDTRMLEQCRQPREPKGAAFVKVIERLPETIA
jgi:hypothetical protein